MTLAHNPAAGLADVRLGDALLVTWNAYIGQSDRDVFLNLTRMVRDIDDAAGTRPDLICLQEVWDWEGTIRGYEALRAPRDRFEHPESRSTIFLVCEDQAEVLRENYLQVDGPDWIGPINGWKHPPRTFPNASIRVRRSKTRLDALGLHRTPGGPRAGIRKNRKSWAAEHVEIEDWFERRENRRTGRLRVGLGDLNDRASTVHPLSISSLTRQVDGKLVIRGIDGAHVVNGDARAVELTSRYGSDGHHPVALVLDADGKN